MPNSNIDNIINKIKKDSDNSAEEIINEANKKAKGIINETRVKAEQKAIEIEEKANQEANEISLRQAEATELKARDIVLEAKNEVVNKIFDLAYERLLNLSNEEFLNSINKNVENLKLEDPTLIVPEKYKKYISENSNYKISDQKIEEGYKIDLGDIVYNNDFKDLIDDQYFKFDNKYFEGLF
jgi:V/A-type H+-transporting ATPase subunit E